MVREFDGYNDRPHDYLRIFDLSHEVAFEAAYEMGGRRRSATFDEYAYVDTLIAEMVRRAYQEGLDEMAENITATVERWEQEDAEAAQGGGPP